MIPKLNWKDIIKYPSATDRLAFKNIDGINNNKKTPHKERMK